VRRAVERCGHRAVLSTTARQYYLDTSRMRLRARPVSVTLFQRAGG
jgi:hypothetical protein